MIRKTLVLAITGALCGVATAQPVDQPTTDVAPTPPPPPPRPAPPPPVVVVTPPPPPEHVESIHDFDHDRPDDLSFAIGIGYVRPPGGSLDLQTPNIASARLRLISGLTFEPTVTIENSSIDMDNGTMSMTETVTEFGLGTVVRFPVIRHGKFDFEILGNIAFDITKDDPDGDFNTKTTTDLTLGWGIAIGYWITHHWQLSASATNPLVTYTKTSTEIGENTSQSTSETDIGISFDPTIAVMIHLYN
jgi:hypothetical protein